MKSLGARILIVDEEDVAQMVGRYLRRRVHIKNLREKIEPDPANPTYVKTVPRHGYTISTHLKSTWQK